MKKKAFLTPIIRRCEKCLSDYQPSGHNQKYCNACQTAIDKEIQVKRNKGGYRPKQCIRCGGLYKPTASSCKYCLDCREKAKKEVAREYGIRKWREKEHPRKKRNYGTTTCHICGIIIQRTSISHIYCQTCAPKQSYKSRRSAVKTWLAKNPGKVAEYCRRRRSRRRSVAYDITDEHWRRCLEFFDYRCAYCEKQTKLERDHFIPISKGGSTTKNNIVPACKSCNSSKWSRDPDLWCTEDQIRRITQFFREINSE